MASAQKTERTKWYTWQPWGPIYNSIRTERAGFLGVDYTTGCDTRWGDLRLGPQFNTIDLSGAGGTAASSIGMARATGGGVVYGYVARGTVPAKVKLSDMSLQTNAVAAFPEAVTSICTTKNSAGTVEVNFGHAASAYRSITTIAVPPAADTVTANSAAVLRRILRPMPDRVGGLQGQSFFSNIISAGGTMAAPAWTTLGTYGGPDITPTGLALNNNYWLVATDLGPISLNAQFNKWNEIGNLTASNTNNGRAVRWIRWAGTIVPMERSTLAFNGQDVERIGPERWLRNTSPARGQWMGIGDDDDWGICSMYNSITGHTYIVAFRPRSSEEGGIHPHPLSYFTIGRQSSDCLFIEYIGKDGGRASPTWMGGIGTGDAWYMLGANTQRWPDDTAYRYATASQIAYLTECQEDDTDDKLLQYMEFETTGCTAAVNITVGWEIDGRAAETVHTITGNGRHRLDFEGLGLQGWRIRPVFTLTNGGTNTTTPVVISLVKVKCALTPRRGSDGNYRRGEVP